MSSNNFNGPGHTAAAQNPPTSDFGSHAYANPQIIVQQPIVNSPITNVTPMTSTAQADLWDFGGDPTIPNIPHSDVTMLNVYEIRKNQKRPMMRLFIYFMLAVVAGAIVFVKI